MLHPQQLAVLVFAGIAAFALFGFARQLREGIENFKDRFGGGGPRPPTHPLQANDAFVVLRQRKKQT